MAYIWLKSSKKSTLGDGYQMFKVTWPNTILIDCLTILSIVCLSPWRNVPLGSAVVICSIILYKEIEGFGLT